MRWGLLAVLLGLAVAATLALFWAPTAGEDGGSRIDEHGATSSEAPLLRGTAAPAPSPPAGVAGTIVGFVRRAGVPAAARVELRRVRAWDPRLPRSAQARTSWVDLLLAAPDLGDPVSTVATAEDGAFRFDAVTPGVYEVLAVAADGACGGARAEVQAGGVRVDASIALEAGGETLLGRAVRGDGSPFLGIVYAASSQHPFVRLELSRWVTRTDDRGAFALSGLPRGRVFLHAVVPGVLAVRGIAVDLPHPGELSLTVDVGGRTLVGLVIAAEGGTPVRGATVACSSGGEKTRQVAWTTTTDSAGRFSTPSPAGHARGLVTAPGFVPAGFDVVGSAEVVVALVRAGRVVGRVTRAADGSPVAGVPVLAARVTEERWQVGEGASAISDAQGRYALDGLAPGPTAVFALGNGWRSVGLEESGHRGSNPFAVVVLPGGSTTADLVVAEGVVAEGRVVDELGDGVEGALVTASQNDESQGSLPGPVSQARTPAVSGPDGGFAVRDLLPGRLTTIFATAPGRPRASLPPIPAVAEGTRGLVIRLEPGCWIPVRVESTDGVPVPGAVVMGRLTRKEARSSASASTTSDGRARVGPLPPGPFVVSATAEGYLPAANGRGDDACGSPEVVIRLERGSAVAGRVVAPRGVPPPLFVRVRSVGGLFTQVSLDADGGFRAEGLAPDTYSISADLYWDGVAYAAQGSAVAGGDPVELVLAARADAAPSLRVTLTGPDGAPVPAGEVRWVAPPPGQGRSGWVGFSRGRAEVHVPPDTGVWVVARGLPGSGVGMGLAGPLPVAPAEVEVRLGVERTIRGTAVDGEGRPLPGIWVSAFSGPEGRDADADARTVTGRDGGFELRGLGDLEYRVRAAGHPDAPFGALALAHGGDTAVRLEMRLAPEIVLTVLDEERNPVPRAGVLVEGNLPVQATTDAEGTAVLRGLRDSTTFALTVHHNAYLEERRATWIPRNETITLVRPRELRGRVVDLAGDPVPSARIRYRAASAAPPAWQEARAEVDGSFRLEGLRPEEVLLDAAGAVYGRSGTTLSGPTAVLPGREEVVLRVDAGLSIVGRIAPWTSGQVTMAQIASDEPNPVQSGWVHVDRSGRLVATGLEEGRTYTVFVPFLPDDRVVLARGLAPGGEVRLAAAPGRAITGRVLAPAGSRARDVEVRASQGWIQIGGTVAADGSYRVAGLPEGRWSLHAVASQDGVRLEAQAEVAAGGSVDLELVRPESPR